MTDKILVIGATGNVGSGVLATLAAQGADVRGLAHSEAGATAVRNAGAEAVVADLADPGTLDAAFAGVETAFLLTRGEENQVEMARNAIEAAKRAGVRRIVRLSAFVPEPALETILGRQHDEIERLLRDSGIAYTILRPTFFMQNLMGGAQTVASDGVLYLPFGDGAAGMIDVRDIVDSAVAALTGEGHEGETYTLTGPASISVHEVAAALTRALGRDVSYVAVPVEAGVESLVGMGLPQFMADTFGELFVNFANNGANRTTDGVKRLTGHEARSIDDFARDFAQVFDAVPA
jgi:uncharacterized protein YbjT (DUF2867 family)